MAESVDGLGSSDCILTLFIREDLIASATGVVRLSTCRGTSGRHLINLCKLVSMRKLCNSFGLRIATYSTCVADNAFRLFGSGSNYFACIISMNSFFRFRGTAVYYAGVPVAVLIIGPIFDINVIVEDEA